MAKSTQDLCIWLQQLEKFWEFPPTSAIEIMISSTKQFRLYSTFGDEPFFESPSVDESMDVNDLCYKTPAEFTEYYQIINPQHHHAIPIENFGAL